MKENFPDYELLFKPSKQKSFVGEKQREKKKGAKKKRAGGFTFLSLSIIDVSLSLQWSNPRGMRSTSPPLHLRCLITNSITMRIILICPPSARRRSPSLTSRRRRRRISRSLQFSPMISAVRLSSR